MNFTIRANEAGPIAPALVPCVPDATTVWGVVFDVKSVSTSEFNVTFVVNEARRFVFQAELIVAPSVLRSAIVGPAPVYWKKIRLRAKESPPMVIRKSTRMTFETFGKAGTVLLYRIDGNKKCLLHGSKRHSC